MRATWLLIVGMCCVLSSGCIAKGHRKFTVEVMGNDLITVEDQVYNDETGRPHYHVTVDSFGEWLLGKILDPETEPEMKAAYEERLKLIQDAHLERIEKKSEKKDESTDTT